jgi:glycine cleavage system H protein
MPQPDGLLFTREHEWVKLDGDVGTIGITDYAQNALGDIVFVELPRAGQQIAAHATIGVVESVKSVSDLFSPVGGEIVEVNASIEADPAIVNREPFAAGWLIKVKLSEPASRDGLISGADYDTLIAGE